MIDPRIFWSLLSFWCWLSTLSISDEHCSLNRPTLMDELLSTLSQKYHLDCNFWRLIQRFYWYGHAIWKAASMKNFTFFIFNSFEISSENEWVSDSSFIHAYLLRLFHIWQISVNLLGSHPPATTLYHSSKPCVFIYPVYFFVISLPNTQLRIISPFHGPPSRWLPTCIKIKSRICIWLKKKSCQYLILEFLV